MNDIAICGKDTRFCRMLELELEALGYTVARNPKGGHFPLWIVDLDTAPPHDEEQVYLGITRDETALREEHRRLCHLILRRPFAMSRLREEVARLLSPEQPLTHASRPRSLLLRTPHGFSLAGELLALTDTEEKILQVLYDRRGEAVPRAQLCALLGNESNDKLADVYICLLRKKLEANGIPRLLFTVRGVGYRLENEKNVQ